MAISSLEDLIAGGVRGRRGFRGVVRNVPLSGGGAGGTLEAARDGAGRGAARPAVGAALALAMAARLSAAVCMPYDARLLGLAHWLRQLWAEALGKDGQGATPVVARGARFKLGF